MNRNSKAWKYATVLVVALIILNPEMAQLALFIDAIGLEMFMLLLEVQVVTLFGLLLGSQFKLGLSFIKCARLYQIIESKIYTIVTHPEYLVLAAPSQATVMRLFVSSAAIGFTLNSL